MVYGVLQNQSSNKFHKMHKNYPNDSSSGNHHKARAAKYGGGTFRLMTNSG